MFKLDEDFLESVGLAGMPQAEKEAFLTHLQDELETEVGKKMIEGLDDEQLKEFSEMCPIVAFY